MPNSWCRKSVRTPGKPEKRDGMSLRDLANKAVEQTEFFPGWGRARLEAMIKNRPDWCVSRQRSWGVPMPFFVHRETGQLHPRTPELLEQVAKLVERDGIEAWFSLNSVDLLGAEAEHYRKLSDTLDVWFDSGVTHASVLQQPRSESGADRRPTCIWKAPTSIAAGSSPAC